MENSSSSLFIEEGANETVITDDVCEEITETVDDETEEQEQEVTLKTCCELINSFSDYID